MEAKKEWKKVGINTMKFIKMFKICSLFISVHFQTKFDFVCDHAELLLS